MPPPRTIAQIPSSRRITELVVLDLVADNVAAAYYFAEAEDTVCLDGLSSAQVPSQACSDSRQYRDQPKRPS